ncbi:MAG: glycosyltransferase family 4 protein [Myxococcota bacterium]
MTTAATRFEDSTTANRAGVRPLRVLMILESDFTKRGGGGAESQVRTLALQLVRLKQRVTVLTPLLARGPQIKVERCYGLPVGRVSYPRWKIIGGGIMCARFAAFLLANRNRYDAWHVHIAHHLGAVACVIGAAFNKPVIVKISGFWELEHGIMAPQRGLIGKAARLCFQRASVLQAISTRIANDLIAQGFPADRIVVLPNAVDTSRFSGERRGRAPGAPFTAVFVGRLVPEKGLPTLLEAWASAFSGRSDVRLRLLGGGVLEKPLRELVQKLGISQQVEFLGHQDRVEDILAEADVGVLPSRIEGLSNTLLEYMASGLPVLATRISGSEDFVEPGQNGWLFEVGDVNGLSQHLQAAAGMPSEQLLELGRNARRAVETRATLDLIVGRLLSLYRGSDPREMATNEASARLSAQLS